MMNWRMMQRVSILTTIILLASQWLCPQVAADTVTLNNGDELYGVIRTIDDDHIVLLTDSGDQTVGLSDCVKVTFWARRGVKGETTIADIKDPDLITALKNRPSPVDEPDAGHVTLLSDLDFSVDGTGRVSRTVHVSVVVLKERSRDLANPAFSYLGNRERGRYLWGRTIVGDTIFDMREDAISDESHYYYLKQYDRLRIRKTALPEVNVGSVFNYCYQIESDPHTIDHPFFAEYFFRRRNPSRTRRITVSIPENAPFVYKLHNDPENTIGVEKKRSGNNLVYEFNATNQPGFREEDYMPSTRKVFPWIAFGIDYGWADVCRFWNTEAQARMQPSPLMKDAAKEITTGTQTPRGKAMKLYRYVCREFDHYPVGMGEYSYLPRPVAEVFLSKVANSLDKVCLYVSLLSCVGVEADVVLLRSDSAGPVLRSIATLGQFTTVLARLSDGTWVAPFSDHYLFDELPIRFQGAEGLVPATGDFVKVPLGTPQRESMAADIDARLTEAGALEVTAHFSYFGDNDASMRGNRQLRDDELAKQMQEAVHYRHPNAVLCDYSFKYFDDPEKQVELELSYTVPQYAMTAGERLMVFKFPELVGTAGWMETIAEFGSPTRQYDLWWGWRGMLSNSVRIQLPLGWKIRHLPEQVDDSITGMRYSATLKRDKRTIIIEDSYVREAIELPKRQYDAMKSVLERRARFVDEWVVVEKNE